MRNLQPSEFRTHPRIRIPGSLPGNLVCDGLNFNFKIHPVDISISGLGLIINKYLPAGTKFTYFCYDRVVSLELVWCQREAFSDSFRRCGLKCTVDTIDLIDLVTEPPK